MEKSAVFHHLSALNLLNQVIQSHDNGLQHKQSTPLDNWFDCISLRAGVDSGIRTNNPEWLLIHLEDSLERLEKGVILYLRTWKSLLTYDRENNESIRWMD